MIIFNRVRWKNFLSTGNTFTELDLVSHPTTLIVGNNGSGKSTFLDAITFSLFAKPFRKINKPQLINSINKKNLLVEIEFSVGGNEYLVRRGLKPTIFEIFQNGNLLNQDAAAKDYQENLEKQILKLNYKSFCQIIILGSSTFVPFMQLSTAHRREIIEDILDLEIFSNMNILLKDRIQQNKIDISEIKNKLDVLKEKILLHREMQKKLKQNDDDRISEINNKINSALVKIQDYISLLEKINKETDSLRNSICDVDEIKNADRDYDRSILSLTEKGDRLEKELKFYMNHDNCPTCKQDILSDHKHDITNTKTIELQEITDKLNILREKKTITQNRLYEISNISQSISTNQRKITEYETHISNGKSFIKNLKQDLSKFSSQPETIVDSCIMEDMKKEWLFLDNKKEELLKDKEILDAAALLLKDNGIKGRIIKQYIPVINTFINKYLAIVELPVGFELDEVFNETIKSRFRDEFSYPSFSEGEKMRINLAIMFTWRAIAKLRNSAATNLLILDEVFDSSLDVDGVDQVAQIIKSISEDSNVFIISHKETLIDQFTNTIRFEKKKDFSRISTS